MYLILAPNGVVPFEPPTLYPSLELAEAACYELNEKERLPQSVVVDKTLELAEAARAELNTYRAYYHVVQCRTFEGCKALYDIPDTGQVIGLCGRSVVRDGYCEFHKAATTEESMAQIEAALDEMRGE